MRESNFCNPAQNKASVCISAAVYDRRAIDCTATLPLINSLNHLAYLTSTSPRIREMVTLDGGLERLIRILRTVPKSPSPHNRAISIKEMQAIWKWSLAFQCVVNIGVRGSEDVRTRVVEAGMVPVTIRVLESYLRGMEKLKEERRREALAYQQRRDERRDERFERSSRDQVRTSASTSTSTSASSRPQHHHRLRQDSNTTTHSSSSTVAAPTASRRSQHTLETRRYDPNQSSTESLEPAGANVQLVSASRQGQQPHSSSRSARGQANHADETRPTTPLESDASAARASVFVSLQTQSSSNDFIPSQSSAMSVVDSSEGHPSIPLIDAIDPISLPPNGTVSAVGPDATPRAISSAHVGGPSLNVVSSSEDLRSHAGEASGSGSEGPDDAEMFADDADADDSEVDASQSAAPILIAEPIGILPDEDADDRQTPRPVRRSLAPLSDVDLPPQATQHSYVTPNRPTNIAAPPLFERQETVRPSRGFGLAANARNAESANAASTALAAQVGRDNDNATADSRHSHQSHHHRHHPHAHQHQAQHQHQHQHQHEHQQRHHQHHQHHQREHAANLAARTAHIHATTNAAQAQSAAFVGAGNANGIDMIYREEEVLLSLQLLAYLSKYAHVRILFHTSDLTNTSLVGPLDALNEQLDQATRPNKSWDPSEPPRRNVFSIAEKFTLRPSRTSSALYPAPRLSMEIQYWAGVIMRNACRKDESRGGIRQCANMLCGKWEQFPREFAKCRRCRKAKYCSKQCQSKGWQMGHRFWCSAKSDDPEGKEKEREKQSSRNAGNAEGRPADLAMPAVGDAALLEANGFALGQRTADGHMGDPEETAQRRLFGDARLAEAQHQQQQQQHPQHQHRHQHLHHQHQNQNPNSNQHLHPHQSQHLYHQRASEQTSQNRVRQSQNPAQSHAHEHQHRQQLQPQQQMPHSRDHHHPYHTHDQMNQEQQQHHYLHNHHRQQASTERPHSASSSTSHLGDPGFASSADEVEDTETESRSLLRAPGTIGSSSSSSAALWLAGGHTTQSHRATPPFASTLHSDSDPFASSNSSPAGPTNAHGREARRAIVPGSLGLPSAPNRRMDSGDLRDRRVTSLASLDTLDGSDVSEDESERRLAQMQGMHPAIAAAAVAAAATGARGEADRDAPLMAPQRTDLAGRPLPPPVIASQNAEEDELALGGRATPGAVGEQDFATGEIDQMLGHWATRRNGLAGLQHRLADIRAEVPSPERPSSPDVASYPDSTENSTGARSDDEEITAPRARYHALYGQHAYHPSPLRGHTPQAHHRLHQQRSVSGFNELGGHGARQPYGESLGEPSTLHGYRASMVSSPLAQTPSRQASVYENAGGDSLLAHRIDRALQNAAAEPGLAPMEWERARAVSHGGDIHMSMDAPVLAHPMEQMREAQLSRSTGDEDVDMEL